MKKILVGYCEKCKHQALLYSITGNSGKSYKVCMVCRKALVGK